MKERRERRRGVDWRWALLAQSMGLICSISSIFPNFVNFSSPNPFSCSNNCTVIISFKFIPLISFNNHEINETNWNERIEFLFVNWWNGIEWNCELLPSLNEFNQFIHIAEWLVMCEAAHFTPIQSIIPSFINLLFVKQLNLFTHSSCHS